MAVMRLGRHNGSVIPFGLVPLAVDRQFAIVAALVALVVSALTESVGAWVLLARERRLDRARREDGEGSVDEEPVAGSG